MKKELEKPWYLLFALLSIGGYFIITNALQILTYKLLPEWINFQPSSQEEILMYLDSVDIIISIVLLLLVLFVYRKVKRMKSNEHVNVVKLDQKGLLLCVTSGLAIAGITFVLSFLSGTNDYGSRRNKGLEELIMMVLTSVGFAPFIEEMLFRGIVYKFLSRFKSGWFAVTVSALIFGAYHMDLIQGVYTFIMGMILAYIYWKTDNIKYPILVHAVNNAFVCLVGSVFPIGVRPVFNWLSVVMVIPAAYFLMMTGRKQAERSKIK